MKYRIEGTHRNRTSYVLTGEGTNEKILFVIEREDSHFMNSVTGSTYIVRKCETHHDSFLADSWREVAQKLHALLS
jgi:hypothetical protein